MIYCQLFPRGWHQETFRAFAGITTEFLNVIIKFRRSRNNQSGPRQVSVYVFDVNGGPAVCSDVI